MKQPVTVLGLGAMGAALARAFLDAGHPTTIWNRTPGRAPELDQLGAVRADSVGQAVAASPLVVVCLLVDATVHQALDGVDVRGRTIVNLTNGTPEQARATAERFAGARYLDGGIMAVPEMIGGPAAFIFYSGPEAAFEEHRDALSALARPAYVGADPGLAALYDIALLSAMYGMFGGAEHALALITSERIPASAFTADFLLPWLTAMLGSLPQIADTLDNGAAPGAAGSNLAMQAAAYDNLIDAALAQGVDPMLLRPMGDLMKRAVAEGHGDEDSAVTVRLLSSAS
ncbi:NAD(P)-dependent oxidoreductase [Kribbella sandramycini]|uniref:3-hydroxyisobutyrate dehydrogenase-like beta-hydroxyacid dehydrogenase n=1 Tax=Kribbella sandramycini TaxID=60450 RepID=A0A7Y4L2S0_9ACTN|nr:NAD(P)-binding domain-containing protein [Kribbella sandramycini]MBB6564637.1 3-hydroxyisobutyrate dehydrogenase-like beta-hydroxyacid dehydrogenase [Kribbella sandramycini]NOL42341.1 NAD(P)-dependent oxidoreductase [Kribbella sandramycini]